MRGRFEVPEIAEKVGRHQSTVYKWFRERDKQNAKKAA
jgi:transposase